jgi:hypothetical protein
MRNSNWRSKRVSRRAYLKSKDFTLAAMFRAMYPDVPIREREEEP